MQANRELESLIVVEGYMDVIALAQHGIRNVVATLGTAITEDHLTRLFKLIKQVIFCFDGDRAGADAAKKAFKIVLPLMQDGRQVKFLLLPEKEDPDSMVRRCGATDFKERINNAMNFSDFLFSKNLAKCDMESIDGRAKLVNISLPLINQIPHGIFREMLLKQLAGFGQIDVNTINAVNHVDNAVNQQESVVNNIPQRKQKTSGLSGFPPVRRVICLLLQYPHFASLRDDEQNWSHLKLPGAELLAEMFDILNKNPALKTAAILEHWRERQEEKFLFKLAQIDLEVSEKDSEKNFLATFDFLKQEMIDDRKNNLLNKSKTNQLNQDEMIELNKLLKTKIL
jgi:DNA primase